MNLVYRFSTIILISKIGTFVDYGQLTSKGLAANINIYQPSSSFLLDLSFLIQLIDVLK